VSPWRILYWCFFGTAIFCRSWKFRMAECQNLNCRHENVDTSRWPFLFLPNLT
jgi:hypothetical protein